MGDSQYILWTNPDDGNVYVPNVNVNGANRNFNLNDFRNQLNSNYGVLVFCQSLQVMLPRDYLGGVPFLNN